VVSHSPLWPADNRRSSTLDSPTARPRKRAVARGQPPLEYTSRSVLVDP